MAALLAEASVAGPNEMDWEKPRDIIFSPTDAAPTPSGASETERKRARDKEIDTTGSITKRGDMKATEDLNGVHDEEAHTPWPERRTSPRLAASVADRNELIHLGTRALKETLASKNMDPIVAQMLEAGYSREEALQFAAEAREAGTQQTVRGLILALRQLGKFSIKIWDESFIGKLETCMQKVLAKKTPNEKVKVGVYGQKDSNGRTCSVITADFSSIVAADAFRNGTFKHGGIDFTASDLDEWLQEINNVKPKGKTFAVIFGPFPCEPCVDMFKPYEFILTKTYGRITHITIYGDRTVAFGFEIMEDKEPPLIKMPLIVLKGGRIIGLLDPIDKIRMLGMENCHTCAGIGGHHVEDKEDIRNDCEANKPAYEKLQKKKRYINGAKGSKDRETKPQQGKIGEGRKAEVKKSVWGAAH